MCSAVCCAGRVFELKRAHERFEAARGDADERPGESEIDAREDDRKRDVPSVECWA
jgi:hypothetical protein